MYLGLTTATPRCTVSLVAPDGSEIASIAYEDEKKHAERLFATLDALLERADKRRADLCAVACDVGPGSFTGVRVGLASAKGVAFALSIPLLGVGSLEAMCAAALDESPPSVEVACALLDAKRGETFLGAYDRSGRAILPPRHALLGGAAEVITSALADRAYVFCGRAAEREGITDALVDEACALPSATWIARIASTRELPEAASVDHIEPTYVRAPDAKPIAEQKKKSTAPATK